jgi:hypothetical protein
MKKTGISIVNSLTASNQSIAIEDFEVRGTKARIKVKIVASAETSKSELLTALNDKFNGKLRAVPKSFKLTAESSANPKQVVLHAIGYVVPNIEVVEASADNMGRMREVANNMFLDESDCIWNQTGGFMYKRNDVESADALQTLLAECASEGSVATRMKRRPEFPTIAGIQSGDFVTYMSKGEMMCGYVLASDAKTNNYMILASTETEPEIVEAFAIQDRIKIEEGSVQFPQEKEMAGAIDVNALIAYYKRVYSYNPAYFAELERRIRSFSFM